MGDAIALLVSTLTASSRDIPPFSASRTPSLKASICTARLRLVAIFMSTAWPLPPTYVTVGPMSRRIGTTRSKASLSPPTITESFPCSRVITLPDTGASSMTAPHSATRSARPRLAPGLTVLMST